MSAIFLPRRWRQQPQGAVDFALDVSGNSIAYIGGQNRIIRGRDGYSTYGTALTTSAAPAGISVAGAADSGINLGRLNIAAIERYTVVFQFRRRTSSRRVLYNLVDSSLGFYQHELIALNSNSTSSSRTGTIQLRLGGTTGVNDYIRVTQASAVTTLGKIHTCAIRLTGPKNVEVWLDGQRITSTLEASTAGYPNTDDSPLSVLSANLLNSSSGTLGGDYDLFMFARLLQDRPDARELSIDPYGALFRAPSHRIWFDVGAGASGTTYNESLTESATLGDSLDPLAAFFASYAESVTTGDSADNAQTHAAALSESVTPADSATSAQTHAETLAESVTADDSAAPAQTMPVALSEDVTAGDALADEVVPAGSFNETIAESATVDDAYASTQAHVEALAEQISVGDGYTVTGGTEVEQRRGAPAGPPLRIWRYSARIGGRMVYADTQQALQAAIAEFEDSVPARAEKKAQKAGKVVVRRLPKVQIVDAPEEERGQVQAQAQAANDRIAAEYLAALQAQIAIREAMERDDMEAIIALDFL